MTFAHAAFLQGTPIKDVVISDSAPSTLLLEKHIGFIDAYSSKKDDYVSIEFAITNEV